MKINISVLSGLVANKIFVDTSDGTFRVNGKDKKLDANKFVDRLLGIVVSWQSEMIGPQVLDGEIYTVDIADGDETAHFVGKNSFPDNYDEFVYLIDEVVGNG